MENEQQPDTDLALPAAQADATVDAPIDAPVGALSDDAASLAVAVADKALLWEAPAWEVLIGLMPGETALTDTEADPDTDPLSAQADDLLAAEMEALTDVEPVEPPTPRPVRLVALNERLPASAGYRVYWREAGFECRGVIERGRVSVTCKGPGDSKQSQTVEILLKKQCVSQGEAVAFMASCLSFDPTNAASHGFDIVGKTVLPF